MKVYYMALDELREWVKNKPEIGDAAYCKTHHDEREYMYVYTGPDTDPIWVRQEDAINKYLEEINKLKVEDITVNKRCENCKYFEGTSFKTKIQDYWCTHEKYSGTRIARHTSCPDWEDKEKKSTPFDGVKFYLKDASTGELDIKYICEDCGKIMDEPGHWWLVLPVTKHAAQYPTKRHGYHFRCEKCDKKKEGKV